MRNNPYPHLKYLRGLLGRGPTELFLWLLLMAHFRTERVDPISNECLARQVKCSSKSLCKWRRKLEDVGLLRSIPVTAHGKPGHAYELLKTESLPTDVLRAEFCDEDVPGTGIDRYVRTVFAEFEKELARVKSVPIEERHKASDWPLATELVQ